MSAAFVLLPGFIAMAAMFALFGNILIKIMDVFSALFPIIPLLFNPPRLANEIITGVSVGLLMVIEKVMGFFNPAKYGPDAKPQNTESAVSRAEKNCYKTDIMNIIFLILCPPFAVFQSSGFVFHEIFLCTILTVYGYYFPGLIYAIIATGVLTKKEENEECKKE